MIDFSVILAPLLQLWWLLPIVAVVLFFKSPTGKGIVGEGLLNFVINIALDKKKYQLLKNVTLKTDDGTTQIDHIIVSQYGIFVIETKNMKGWIFGSENQKIWTHNIYKQKHKFQNPLHQNYKHTKTLEKLLNISGNRIFSIVVFVGDATFKIEMPENVVYPRGLFRFIDSHRESLFTPREMWRIIEDIEDAQLAKGFKTNREHVQNLKTRTNYAPKRPTIKREFKNKLYCPKCGNGLIIRTAKRGNNIGSKFYGCTNYPRCKYTKNIT